MIVSGHSKWSQIKHKKAASDAKRGQAFSKMVREISVAAKIGGTSPGSNARLRAAIERARSLGLPKDNIERAVSKASGGSGGVALQEFLYEAVAPGGITILIEGITDNKNRVLAEIRHLLSERGAKLAEPGSLLWGFKKVGMVEVCGTDNPTKSREEIGLDIIDAGAEDFQELGGSWSIETDFSRLDEMRKALENRGLKLRRTSHDYRPGSAIDPPDDQKEVFEKLLDVLANHDDVLEVYTNLKEFNF